MSLQRRRQRHRKRGARARTEVASAAAEQNNANVAASYAYWRPRRRIMRNVLVLVLVLARAPVICILERVFARQPKRKKFNRLLWPLATWPSLLASGSGADLALAPLRPPAPPDCCCRCCCRWCGQLTDGRAGAKVGLPLVRPARFRSVGPLDFGRSLARSLARAPAQFNLCERPRRENNWASRSVKSSSSSPSFARSLALAQTPRCSAHVATPTQSNGQRRPPARHCAVFRAPEVPGSSKSRAPLAAAATAPLSQCNWIEASSGVML